MTPVVPLKPAYVRQIHNKSTQYNRLLRVRVGRRRVGRGASQHAAAVAVNQGPAGRCAERWLGAAAADTPGRRRLRLNRRGPFTAHRLN